VARKPKKPKAEPALAAPVSGCAACKGSGFVRLAAAPNRTGLDGRQIKYDPPLVRCECGNNQVKGFDPEAAKPIDSARRAAGERDE
jgi:hypothetical protein